MDVVIGIDTGHHRDQGRGGRAGRRDPGPDQRALHPVGARAGPGRARLRAGPRGRDRGADRRGQAVPRARRPGHRGVPERVPARGRADGHRRAPARAAGHLGRRAGRQAERRARRGRSVQDPAGPHRYARAPDVPADETRLVEGDRPGVPAIGPAVGRREGTRARRDGGRAVPPRSVRGLRHRPLRHSQAAVGSGGPGDRRRPSRPARRGRADHRASCACGPRWRPPPACPRTPR